MYVNNYANLQLSLSIALHLVQSSGLAVCQHHLVLLLCAARMVFFKKCSVWYGHIPPNEAPLKLLGWFAVQIGPADGVWVIVHPRTEE